MLDSVDGDAEAVALAFLTASRALVGIAVRSVAVAPVSLTIPQHRLLVLVSINGPHRIGALADELGVNQSNASRLVDRLVGHGLVQRVMDPADRRATLVDVTAPGIHVLEVVSEHRLRELRAVVAAMPSHSLAPAAQVLREFNVAANEPTPQAAIVTRP